MKTHNEKAQGFWDLHQTGSFVLPDAWDAGAARLLEEAGAVALGTMSTGLAWANGGKDGSHTRDAAVANTEDIASATDLLVTADFSTASAKHLRTLRRLIDQGSFDWSKSALAYPVLQGIMHDA